MNLDTNIRVSCGISSSFTVSKVPLSNNPVNYLCLFVLNSFGYRFVLCPFSVLPMYGSLASMVSCGCTCGRGACGSGVCRTCVADAESVLSSAFPSVFKNDPVNGLMHVERKLRQPLALCTVTVFPSMDTKVNETSHLFLNVLYKITFSPAGSLLSC